MSLFSIQALTCKHGLLTAVREISFDIERGEALCIIGANGAGKTTLLRSLAGVHPPAEGSISLNGKTITAQRGFERVRAGVSMSPEGRRLFADLTVRENLMVSAEHGRKGLWTLDRLLEAFDQLKPIIDKPAGSLSGGQRQAVAVGRALLANPDVLLLDEVSLGLSPAAIEGMYVSLDAIKNTREMAMVVVEQDLNRALGFADTIICMAEGRAELQGKPADFSKAQITAAYFGIHDKVAQDG
jgi:branched-chain amino acid transport system ATP-binding protein